MWVVSESGGVGVGSKSHMNGKVTCSDLEFKSEDSDVVPKVGESMTCQDVGKRIDIHYKW